MALYLISYDLHNRRVYTDLYDLMALWKAKRLLESVWLAKLIGPAETVRDFVRGTLDGDDSVAVIELEPTAEWAVIDALPGGVSWLQRNIPFRA
jgi:hypothetical protein